MSPIASLLVCTALLNLWIGLYVYRKSSHVAQKRAFTFMAATIGLWTAAVAIANYGTVGHVWAARFAFAAGSLIPLGVLTFVQHIPPGTKSAALSLRLRTRLFIPAGLAFCGLSFSSLIVVNVTPLLAD